MENIDLLYDHYKESFDLSKKAQSDRDKFFIILVILIAALFLLVIEPLKTISVFQSLLKENLKVELQFSIYTIQSIFWFLLLYYTMRYYQKVIYIERQYDYLSKLEEILANSIHRVVAREGKNYINNYPLFSDFIDSIYKYIFPIMYIIILLIKIVDEWRNYNNTLNIILNTILALLIIIMTTLYLAFLHPKLQRIINNVIKIKTNTAIN